MDGILFKALDRLPEPWSMVVAWAVYVVVIAIGWAVTWQIVKVISE